MLFRSSCKLKYSSNFPVLAPLQFPYTLSLQLEWSEEMQVVGRELQLELKWSLNGVSGVE